MIQRTPLLLLVLLPSILLFLLPSSTVGFVTPSRSLQILQNQQRTPSVVLAVTTGGTRKADAQSSSSSSSNSDNSNTPRWKTKVEAKRPFLGHVVPKTSTTRQQDNHKEQQLQEGSSKGKRKIRPQGQFTDEHPRKTSRAPPLKILGGTFRGRKLWSPVVHLRPMMGKVREACFSTLTYFELYKPPTGASTKALCRHLDIFAGSGSVGLESLSRGATHCTFVDFAPECCDTIQANLDLCGVPEKGQVIHADAMEMLRDPVSALQKNGIPCTGSNDDHPLLLPYQIVTMCPPYEEVVYGDLIDAVCNSPLVTDDTIVLIEYPVELGCLPHVYDLKSGGKMIGLRNRKYGRTVVALYIINPSGRLEAADSRPEEFVSL